MPLLLAEIAKMSEMLFKDIYNRSMFDWLRLLKISNAGSIELCKKRATEYIKITKNAFSGVVK